MKKSLCLECKKRGWNNAKTIKHEKTIVKSSYSYVDEFGNTNFYNCVENRLYSGCCKGHVIFQKKVTTIPTFRRMK